MTQANSFAQRGTVQTKQTGHHEERKKPKKKSQSKPSSTQLKNIIEREHVENRTGTVGASGFGVAGHWP
jgi:hypothetical protein